MNVEAPCKSHPSAPTPCSPDAAQKCHFTTAHKSSYRLLCKTEKSQPHRFRQVVLLLRRLPPPTRKKSPLFFLSERDVSDYVVPTHFICWKRYLFSPVKYRRDFSFFFCFFFLLFFASQRVKRSCGVAPRVFLFCRWQRNAFVASPSCRLIDPLHVHLVAHDCSRAGGTIRR